MILWTRLTSRMAAILKRSEIFVVKHQFMFSTKSVGEMKAYLPLNCFSVTLNSDCKTEVLLFILADMFIG